MGYILGSWCPTSDGTTVGLAWIRIRINLPILISNRRMVSHLFWRAALASVRFVRKVFWEGCQQTGVSRFHRSAGSGDVPWPTCLFVWGR
jgi:hypothetical protein